MSGSGKGVSGVVGISRNGSGAGTFPDIRYVHSQNNFGLTHRLSTDLDTIRYQKVVHLGPILHAMKGLTVD